MGDYYYGLCACGCNYNVSVLCAGNPGYIIGHDIIYPTSSYTVTQKEALQKLKLESTPTGYDWILRPLLIPKSEKTHSRFYNDELLNSIITLKLTVTARKSTHVKPVINDGLPCTAFRVFWKTHCNGASSRNLRNHLTPLEWLALVQQHCHYCDSNLGIRQYHRKRLLPKWYRS